MCVCMRERERDKYIPQNKMVEFSLGRGLAIHGVGLGISTQLTAQQGVGTFGKQSGHGEDQLHQ